MQHLKKDHMLLRLTRKKILPYFLVSKVKINNNHGAFNLATYHMLK